MRDAACTGTGADGARPEAPERPLALARTAPCRTSGRRRDRGLGLPRPLRMRRARARPQRASLVAARHGHGDDPARRGAHAVGPPGRAAAVGRRRGRGPGAPGAVVDPPPADGRGARERARHRERRRGARATARSRVAATVPGVVPGGEGGLLGLAFRAGDGDRPDYVYAYFTAASDNRIVRMPLTGAPGSLGLGAPEDVLTGIPKAGNHDGGRIAFGPDGFLYATAGDAGNRDAAQDPRRCRARSCG